MQIRKTVETTDMEGYLLAVKNLNGAILLDVREEDEFQVGHISGAVNIPRELLEFRVWKQLGYPTIVDTKRKIFVQCMTGGRATLATKQLSDIGFTNVVAVIMNFGEWSKKGNPLVKYDQKNVPSLLSSAWNKGSDAISMVICGVHGAPINRSC